MKNRKIIALLCFSLTLFSCGGAKVVTPQAKTLAELKSEEYINKITDIKSRGLKVSGTSRSLEVALKTHFNNLDSNKYTEIITDEENCPTINLCSRKSLTDASAEYATLASSFLRGKVTSEAGYDASSTTDNLAKDRFYGAYEQKVSSNISGVLTKSFSLVRKESNGNYFYQTYYLIETAASKQARLKAYQQALAETQENIQFGTAISDYINETPVKD